MKIGEIQDTGNGDTLRGVLDIEVARGSTISATLGTVRKVIVVEINSVEIGVKDGEVTRLVYALDVPGAAGLARDLTLMIKASLDEESTP